MRDSRLCTGSGPNYDPPWWSTLISNILPSLNLRSSRYTDTDSNTITDPSNTRTNLKSVSLSGMESDCRNPPPGCTPRPNKSPRLQIPHQTGQAPHLLAKNLQHQVPTWKEREGHPCGIIHSILVSAATSTDPKISHVVDLVQLGFYFYLEYCKYTKYIEHLRAFQFHQLLDFVLFFGY